MHTAVHSLVSEESRNSFRPRARKPADKTGVPGRGLKIALVNPLFYPSYYSNDYLLPLLPGDKRVEMAGGGLPLLAALVPPVHEVEIFDENVEPLDFEELATFDIIGITGMIVQLKRMREILDELRDYTGILVVGGPYVSVDQDFFNGSCDVLFIGESEATWPSFLEKVANGEAHDVIYEQEERTDLTTLPLPRYDLVPADRYRVASLQFSRGCPFLCEFCDIITIFGRKPRTKTPQQVIAELEHIVSQGFRVVFLVDDNFIGNKKLARELLLELAPWQEERGWPLILVTEASINLADEPELMDLMYRANFRSVFIGIESPSAESLKETRKVQNVRGDSLLDKVKRVRDAGFIIQGGFMVGFDSDGPDIFERQFEFIQQSQIAQAAVSILTAIPSTPLYKRLEESGRLRLNDLNTNFQPLQMSGDELRNGYLGLTKALYEPEAFFERVLGSWGSSEKFRDRRRKQGRPKAETTFRGKSLTGAAALVIASRLAWSLAKDRNLGRLGSAYLRIYSRYKAMGVPGIGIYQFVTLAAQHYHYHKFYAQSRSGDVSVYNTYAYSDAQPEAKPEAKPERKTAPAAAA